MNNENTLRPEYSANLIESGIRGKYASRYREGIVINPNLHQVFSNSEFGTFENMAEIFRLNGFQFFMPSNDHEPAHVHVRKAEFKIKIDISGERAKIMDESSKDRKLQKQALKIADSNLTLLKTAWRKRPQ